MLLRLIRTDFRRDGVFGELSDCGEVVAHTLEHAYEGPGGDFIPKLPPGNFTCQRGLHQLESMAAPFETFEICDVPGHSGILFHVGNFNQDSSGCVLLGTEVTEMSGNQMLTGSRTAFTRFMKLLEGINEFQLVVE